MQPLAASLSFNLPPSVDVENLEEAGIKYYPYLNGRLFKSIWGPLNSTVHFLVPFTTATSFAYPSSSTTATFPQNSSISVFTNEVTYEVEKYVNQLKYFNLKTRQSNVYSNPFLFNNTPIDLPLLTNNYDSTAENTLC